MWKCALLKNQENPKQKTVSWFFWNRFKEEFIFAHGKIQCLKNVLHYLNMKIPDILVEIIDLQLWSSLKWDGV